MYRKAKCCRCSWLAFDKYKHAFLPSITRDSSPKITVTPVNLRGDAIYGVTPFTGWSRAVPGRSSAPEEKLGHQSSWNRHPVLGFWLRLWGFLGHPWDSSLGFAFPGICSSAPPAGDGLCLQLRVQASGFGSSSTAVVDSRSEECMFQSLRFCPVKVLIFLGWDAGERDRKGLRKGFDQ